MPSRTSDVSNAAGPAGVVKSAVDGLVNKGEGGTVVGSNARNCTPDTVANTDGSCGGPWSAAAAVVGMVVEVGAAHAPTAGV